MKNLFLALSLTVCVTSTFGSQEDEAFQLSTKSLLDQHSSVEQPFVSAISHHTNFTDAAYTTDIHQLLMSLYTPPISFKDRTISLPYDIDQDSFGVSAVPLIQFQVPQFIVPPLQFNIPNLFVWDLAERLDDDDKQNLRKE